jgi:hypothetical protein
MDLLNTDAWSMREMLNCVALLQQLEGQGVSDLSTARRLISSQLDILRLTERRNATISRSEKRFHGTLTCPHCGEAMIPIAVNVSRCTQVGGAWKSLIQCTNHGCLYDELSLKTPMQIRIGL